jgi:hypothetical protein
MKALHIRQQRTVADPLQSERLLKALKIILEHQEDQDASSMLCPRLDQSYHFPLTLRHKRRTL